METVDPTAKNQEQFMRVDKHSDFFSNFFSNFLRQLKNPTQFSFFKVPALEAVETANEMQHQVNKPTPEGEKLMKEHEVKAEPKEDNPQEKKDNMETAQEKPETKENNQQENKNSMETAQEKPEANGYRFQADQIDWETMKNFGLSKEYLEKKNLLEPLLKGYKTNELVPVGINFGTAVIRADVRLSLFANEEGKVVPLLNGIRKEPNLHSEFYGHKFTEEDKKNLLETGNMGRVVNLKDFRTGNLIPSIISIDRLTNDVSALRTEFMKIPDEIKGVKLNDAQKQTLMEGKPLFLEGMISKGGKEFSATIQYNAEKHYPEFLFDKNSNNKQAKGNEQKAEQKTEKNQKQEAPRTFRGTELTDEQYKNFSNGQSVYIELTDKKGQPYQGYITLDKESGKTGFEFPSQYKERVKPDEAHKTQTAVNSEGKTNEATKNIKEPLKSGQQRPKNEKQQKKQDEEKSPAKSKGRKVS